MRCDGCGAEGWLKTVVCRHDRDRRGTLCDPCWLPLRDRLWIVPGPLSVTGKCEVCRRYVNPAELDGRTTFVNEVYKGTCGSCAAMRTADAV